MNYYKLNKKEGGFSLIEMIIAMSIFIVTVSIVAMVFSNNSSYQKRILRAQDVENNARYIMEFISRELRTIKSINNNQASMNLGDSELIFENYKSEITTYCASDAAGTCNAAGEFIARVSPSGPQVLNTSTVRIKNLKFVTNDFTELPYRQKIITVFFTVESFSDPLIKLDIQTSISERLY